MLWEKQNSFHSIFGTHDAVVPAPVPPWPNCSGTGTIQTTLVSSAVTVMTTSSSLLNTLSILVNVLFFIGVFLSGLPQNYWTHPSEPWSVSSLSLSLSLSHSLMLVYLSFALSDLSLTSSPFLLPIFLFLSLSPLFSCFVSHLNNLCWSCPLMELIMLVFLPENDGESWGRGEPWRVLDQLPQHPT